MSFSTKKKPKFTHPSMICNQTVWPSAPRWLMQPSQQKTLPKCKSIPKTSCPAKIQWNRNYLLHSKRTNLPSWYDGPNKASQWKGCLGEKGCLFAVEAVGVAIYESDYTHRWNGTCSFINIMFFMVGQFFFFFLGETGTTLAIMSTFGETPINGFLRSGLPVVEGPPLKR